MKFQMPSYQTKKLLLNIQSGYCSSWRDSSLECIPQRLFPIKVGTFDTLRQDIKILNKNELIQRHPF